MLGVVGLEGTDAARESERADRGAETAREYQPSLASAPPQIKLTCIPPSG